MTPTPWRRTTHRRQDKPLPLWLQTKPRPAPVVHLDPPKRNKKYLEWAYKFRSTMKQEGFLAGKHLLKQRYVGMYAVEIPAYNLTYYTYDLHKAMGWKMGARDAYGITCNVYQVMAEGNNQ